MDKETRKAIEAIKELHYCASCQQGRRCLLKGNKWLCIDGNACFFGIRRQYRISRQHRDEEEDSE